MTTSSSRRRFRTCHHLFALTFLLVALSAALLTPPGDAGAQRQPTPTPAFPNAFIPIEINTPTPTPELVTPEKTPESPGDFAPNPTEEEEIDDLAIADGSITVTLRLCGPDVDPLTVVDPYAECGTYHDGNPVELDAADASVVDLFGTTGDSGAGTVAFPDVLPGTWAVQPELQAGYASMFLWTCVEANSGASLASPVVTYASYELDVASGEAWTCEWFVIPQDTLYTITATKLVCPEGTDPASTLEALGDACTTPLADVEFTLAAAIEQGGVTDASGEVSWNGVELDGAGTFSLDEAIPDGYGEPVVWCLNMPEAAGDPIDFVWFQVPSVEGAISVTPEQHQPYQVFCTFYNIPGGETEGGDVTIHKYSCPAGTEKTDDFYALGETCFEEIDPVDFTVTATSGGYAETKTATAGVPQVAVFEDVPYGEIAIEETVPDGYAWPLVFCTDTPADGPGAYFPVEPWPESGAFILEHRAEAELALTCLVFNFPEEDDGDITIYKWTCPAGYNPTAWGADPETDCTEATNGVEFQFGPDADNSLAELQTTGDVIDGGVFFDNLEPGSWKAVELVPDGIESVFVSECTGHIEGVLQAFPLSDDNVLTIDLAAGEHLVCHWYNIPENPEGTVTVHKYLCTTETFVSDVDCQVYEDGQEFELLAWNGSEWVVIDTATTDGGGDIVWTGLDNGSYQIREVGAEWCHIEAISAISIDEFEMESGIDLVFFVYNCGDTPGDDDTPTKYPDTGVPPVQREAEYPQS